MQGLCIWLLVSKTEVDVTRGRLAGNKVGMKLSTYRIRSSAYTTRSRLQLED